MILSVDHNRVEHVELLLKHGADVTLLNNHGDSALSYWRGGSPKIFELLLKHIPKNHAILDRVFITMVWDGRVDRVRMILEHGISIDRHIY